MWMIQGALLTLLPLASADYSLDSFLIPDGGEGRYFPTISNTSLVITYTTAIVAALMLGSFLWVAATFGQGQEAAGGYGNYYRKKRDVNPSDAGEKLALLSDAWSQQEEEEESSQEHLWEAWRKKEEEEEEVYLRKAFSRHGVEPQDESCQLLLACLEASQGTSQLHFLLGKIRSTSSKRNKKRKKSPEKSVDSSFTNKVGSSYTDRILEAHRRGGSQEDCEKIYKNRNCPRN